MITDFYEYGWGQSFHFAPRNKGESFDVRAAPRWRLTRALTGAIGVPSPRHARLTPRRHARRATQDSIKRYEVNIAKAIDLRAGMKAIDCGCGVGGPMRTIAKSSGAHVTGITINEYQARCAAACVAARLAAR
jgi:24-methylenesterol C-methyltransferase